MARSRRSPRQPSQQSTEPAAPFAATAPEAPAPDPAPEPAPAPAPAVTATVSTEEAQMGGLPDWWTQSYPQVASVTSATTYLDGLGGSLSREQQNGKWVLSTGDQVLYEGGTPEELDSFILGFALSQLIAARYGPIGSAPVQPPPDSPGVSADAGLAEEAGP